MFNTYIAIAITSIAICYSTSSGGGSFDELKNILEQKITRKEDIMLKREQDSEAKRERGSEGKSMSTEVVMPIRVTLTTLKKPIDIDPTKVKCTVTFSDPTEVLHFIELPKSIAEKLVQPLEPDDTLELAEIFKEIITKATGKICLVRYRMFNPNKRGPHASHIWSIS